MHRYGLVYLWHNRQLQNQNRSVTKERRDGQAPSPPRNRNRLPQRLNHQNPKQQKSILSDPQPDNLAKMQDVQLLEPEQVIRAKIQVQKARKRTQKAQGDMAQAQKRVSQMETGLKGLASKSDSRTLEAYTNLLQLAKREKERLNMEHFSALNELQSKEQLLTRLQYRKCSM